jgi:hypothetical protein
MLLEVARRGNKTSAGQIEATQARGAVNKITAGKTQDERRQAINALDRWCTRRFSLPYKVAESFFRISNVTNQFFLRLGRCTGKFLRLSN